jgi:MFS family permease
MTLHTRSYSWFVVFMLCIASIISFIDRQIINLLVEPIKSDLKISDTSISLLQGFAFAIFYSIVAIPLGRLIDNYNRKNIIIGGMFFWSIATMFCGLSKNFTHLFISRIFVGIGEATLAPAGMSIISDYFSKGKLTRALSVFNGSGFLGSGIALLIGGFVINKLISYGPINIPFFGIINPWQLTFIIVSIPGIIFIFFLIFFLKEPSRVKDVNQFSDKENYSLKEAFHYLLTNKNVLGTVIIGFTFMAMSVFSIGAWVPTYFIRTHGLEIKEVANILGLYFMIFGTAGVICGGFFSDWLKNKGYYDSNLRAGFICSLLSVPFIFIFPLFSDEKLSILFLAPVIFFATMPFGTGPSSLPLLVPNRLRGQMVALYLFFGNLIGQGCGPWLVAIFTDFVLQDPQEIRYSISIVCSSISLMGCFILFKGMKPFGDYIKRSEVQVHN